MSKSPTRASWSGQLAFVLAAAASAIGLGNLWRFPYLAAQYGGGTFILIYLILVVTVGFALMLTEIAIGRKTHQSQLTAYSRLHRGWGFLGLLGTIVPFLIASYYCVIGGWVFKYFVTYCQMAFCGAAPMGAEAALSGEFFHSFISANFLTFGYATAFILVCAVVILLGVKNGIEKLNVFFMPMLFVLAIAIAVYVVCLPGSSAGVSYYLMPSWDALNGADGTFSPAQFGRTILGAMGQMFYSCSIAMGIMITYGSYMRKEDSIAASVWRIEFFDTAIALIAGLMIVPMVYLFAVKTGTPIHEAMNAGPGLMFITLPKVFATLGVAGAWVGLAFFALVIFAALTSAISIYEACVASFCDLMPISRRTSTFAVGGMTLFLATFSAFGYGMWSDIKFFGLQFLDFFDFATNSVLMPIVAALTCVFVGWVLKPRAIEEEVELFGHTFILKGFYRFLMKYFAPVLVLLIFVQQVCALWGVKGWAI